MGKYKNHSVWYHQPTGGLIGSHQILDAKRIGNQKFLDECLHFDSLLEYKTYFRLLDFFTPSCVVREPEVKVIPPTLVYPFGKVWRPDFAIVEAGTTDYRLFKVEDVYCLVGKFDSFLGIVRRFNSGTPIEPCLCKWEIHSKDYKIRQKNKEGNYEDVLQVPGVAEVQLFNMIGAHANLLMPEGKAIKGYIDLPPDYAFEGFTLEEIAKARNYTDRGCLVKFQVTEVEATEASELPETVEKGKSYKGISPEQRYEFLRSALNKEIGDGSDSDTSLYRLTKLFMYSRKQELDEVRAFFTFLNNCIK